MTDNSEGDVIQQDRAFQAEQQIVQASHTIQGAMWALAGMLYEFEDGKLYRARGFATFEEWTRSTEITIEYRHVRSLIQGYRALCVDRDVPVEALADVSPSKALVVLPAVARGEVELDTALSDARALSRSDLRVQYRQDREGRVAPPDMEICPACGQIRRSDTT